MALNITVHDPIKNANGSMQQAPTLAVGAPAQVVATGAASTALAAGALLCLIADEDQRIKLTKTAGYSAPAGDGVKLVAGVERWYNLPAAAGSYYISCVAG